MNIDETMKAAEVQAKQQGIDGVIAYRHHNVTSRIFWGGLAAGNGGLFSTRYQ
ncbi:hypothetical protein OO184_19940 [Photorhabdus sp. APURE]|uniref:hypothetical protein n=1 Tax=Photorhabdus aballayi TaxID=2991723 RepID=UPI00223E4357|nr:hypothetical protein [Photorhabdus aballayi]MCW7550139.1 hypothetical protein [Photorhabdus aballayi]